MGLQSQRAPALSPWRPRKSLSPMPLPSTRPPTSCPLYPPEVSPIPAWTESTYPLELQSSDKGHQMLIHPQSPIWGLSNSSKSSNMSPQQQQQQHPVPGGPARASPPPQPGRRLAGDYPPPQNPITHPPCPSDPPQPGRRLAGSHPPPPDTHQVPPHSLRPGPGP